MFSPEALLVLNQHMRRRPPGEEEGEMRRKRPARPRVLLNREAVWALLDELGISQNELARRCGLSPGLPVPADGRQTKSLPAYPATADASLGSERVRRPVHLGNRRRSALTHPHKPAQAERAGNAIKPQTWAGRGSHRLNQGVSEVRVSYDIRCFGQLHFV